MNASHRVSYVGIPGSGVDIISGSSQEFADILAGFAGADTVSTLKSILPYSIIIKNRNAPEVAAVVVRLDGFTNPQGKQIFHQMILPGRLPPGEMVLSTPIGGLNIPLRPGIVGSPALQNTPDLTTELVKRSQEYGAMPAVSVNLDLVAFADGSAIGPDRGDNVNRLNLQRNAKIALATSIMKLAAADRASYLQRLIEAPGKPAVTYEEEDVFGDQQKRSAELMQLYLGAIQNEAALQTALKDYIQSQLPQLHRRGKRGSA